ncbi:molybdenum cofactor guanylyltransferase [Fredinandcohnia quinoae]|uniref:Probable molybdenum cofactor guanylyltransferase n=1 Tax=Fredinandcohnia quinoae TaxID=2918902 RepID=A0AAW5E892_9BACI|nr:molybdenum cofactor guanylyltransferase [Fredinandcohnia sp. SECRCQ15]MCH1625855.1 molybdenum cofactor guanylyltransferase [Fredinandcohnia sp. SECRCQ15]
MVATLTKITGIILAGGESRRFGSPKAFAKFNNEYFYKHAINSLQKNVDNIFIVSHPSIKARFIKNKLVTVIEDPQEYQGNGPLAGILATMSIDESDWYVVLPCDTPQVTTGLIKQLISFIDPQIDAVVPIVDGRAQPLIAVYHSRLKDHIEKLLIEKKFRMQDLLASCSVLFVSEEDLSLGGTEFHNINNQEEYKKLKKDSL